jgi:succinate dehydrogenase/fumarate reductase flavoprotein subunit
MQDYCGEFRSEETLRLGLYWLDSIAETELAALRARNPHELMRALECSVRLTVGQIMMEASLARRASSEGLGFHRLDYPLVDPPEWDKLITVRLTDGGVKTRDLAWDYWRRPPNAAASAQNYALHCGRACDEGEA